MFKDRAMRIFLVHLAAFVAGVLICAGLNLCSRRARCGSLGCSWLGPSPSPPTLLRFSCARRGGASGSSSTRRHARRWCTSSPISPSCSCCSSSISPSHRECGGSIGWRSAGASASAFTSGAASASGGDERRSSNRHGKLRRSLSANAHRGGRSLRLETSIFRNKCVRRQGWIEQAGRLVGAGDGQAFLIEQPELGEHASLVPIDALECDLLFLVEADHHDKRDHDFAPRRLSRQAGSPACHSHA
jgi:hypothetical protein